MSAALMLVGRGVQNQYSNFDTITLWPFCVHKILGSYCADVNFMLLSQMTSLSGLAHKHHMNALSTDVNMVLIS